MSGRTITIFLVVLGLVIIGIVTMVMDTGLNDPQNGEDVIGAMHAEYEGEWYPYLTFRQETTFYEEGEETGMQEWYEALALPGRLAIKFDSLNSGSGVIFRQDTQFVFRDNEMVQSVPRVHDLLVLAFDVYDQDPSVTTDKLRNHGYDMNRMYEDVWQDRPVYVVGADSAGTTRNQFWIDQERLYFVRSLRYNNDTGSVSETQFNNYEEVGGGWVAPEVLFFTDDVMTVDEQYFDIEVPDTLAADIFDTDDFQSATW